jgi:hypothetical protein
MKELVDNMNITKIAVVDKYFDKKNFETQSHDMPFDYVLSQLGLRGV